VAGVALSALGQDESEEGFYDPSEDVSPPEGDDDGELNEEDLKGVHSKIDKNGDGKISLAEVLDYSHSMQKAMAAKQVAEYLDMMDKNQDGKVSLKEFVDPSDESQEDAMEGLSDKEKEVERKSRELEVGKFKIADKNGDGFLDAAELPTAISPEMAEETLGLIGEHTLDRLDANKDGELDFKEFASEGTAGEALDKDAESELDQQFKKLDLDGNGKLNLKEVTRWESGDFQVTHAMDEFFTNADANKDDQLSLAEVNNNLKTLQMSDAGSHFSEWIQHRKSHGEL